MKEKMTKKKRERKKENAACTKICHKVNENNMWINVLVDFLNSKNVVYGNILTIMMQSIY